MARPSIRPSFRLVLVLGLVALAGGCATRAPAPASPDSVRASSVRGAAFAARACAGCHAVTGAGPSPNGEAPAFAALAARTSDADLTRRLGEISRQGHVAMPPIYITPDEIADVVAYMRSLTGRRA